MTLEKLRGDMPQFKAAESLRISKSYLSLLESGKRRISLDLAGKMAELYGVTLEDVLYAYKVCKMSTLFPTGTDN